jgi:hypothetical protein
MFFLFGSFDHYALDLLEKMLTLDPEKVSTSLTIFPFPWKMVLLLLSILEIITI